MQLNFILSLPRRPLQFTVHTSHFLIQNIKKTDSQESRINKVNPFYSIVKVILKYNWPYYFHHFPWTQDCDEYNDYYFFPVHKQQWSLPWLLAQQGANALIWAQAPAAFLPLILHDQQMSKCQHNEKDK